MGIRKNARWLTQTERDAFLKAVITLKAIKFTESGNSMRLYDFYPLEHRLVRRRHRADDGEPMSIAFRDGGHRGPGFGPWHREWLRRFELDLQSVDSSVTLPYWDLTDHQGTVDVIFQPDFMGPNGSAPDQKMTSGLFRESVPPADRPSWWPDDNGSPLQGFLVMRGLTTLISRRMNDQPLEFDTTGLTRDFGDFSTGLPTRSDVRDLLARTPYFQPGNLSTFSVRFEGFDYHAPGHNQVGGLMSAPPTSPNDPIFFLHHCGCDLVWALWQKQHDQTVAENLPPSRGPSPVVGPGHHLEDSMWPWDGTLTANPNKAIPSPPGQFPPPDPNMRPPNFPDAAFTRDVDATDVVKVSDMIDHSSLGYTYDVETPARLEKDGNTLAWIEPYFGDLHLTGTVSENDNGSPGTNDLVYEMDGSVRGWIDNANGNLHVRGQLIADETDFSDSVLQPAIVLRHFNQPLLYFDAAGNLHLKGQVEVNQPPFV